MTRSSVLVLLAGIFVVSLAPTEARACSYALEQWAIPNWREAVPTNTRVWFYTAQFEESVSADEQAFADAFSIVEDATQEPVAFDLADVELRNEFRRLVVLTPRRPLAPHRTYRARSSHPSYLGVSAVFTTGAGPDLEAPAVPTELERSSHAQREESAACGTYSNAYVSYALSDPEHELLVAALEGVDDFDPEELSGRAHAVAFVPESVYESARVAYGTGYAGGGWPDEIDGRTVVARVGAFDIAGNFSGWGEPSKVTRPQLPPDCSVAGVGASRSGAPALAFSLAMLALLRRPSRRRALRS